MGQDRYLVVKIKDGNATDRPAPEWVDGKYTVPRSALGRTASALRKVFHDEDIKGGYIVAGRAVLPEESAAISDAYEVPYRRRVKELTPVDDGGSLDTSPQNETTEDTMAPDIKKLDYYGSTQYIIPGRTEGEMPCEVGFVNLGGDTEIWASSTEERITVDTWKLAQAVGESVGREVRLDWEKAQRILSKVEELVKYYEESEWQSHASKVVVDSVIKKFRKALDGKPEFVPPTRRDVVVRAKRGGVVHELFRFADGTWRSSDGYGWSVKSLVEDFEDHVVVDLAAGEPVEGAQP